MDKFLLASEEGTTQGDALAMPVYALATIPLIHQLRSKVSDTVQIWYAEDVVTASKLSSLQKWWDTGNNNYLRVQNLAILTLI